jgi:hypothetical protein
VNSTETRPAGHGRSRTVSRLRHPVRVLAAAMLASTLGGCAIPPAVAIASYLSDGVLVATTGKSSTDMGLSLATGKDCATLRVLKQENICRDNVEATPEAVPTEVAADEAVQQQRVVSMPADEAARAALSERTLAAAFHPLAGNAGSAGSHPLAGDAAPPSPTALTAVAAELPRAASGTTVVAALAAPPVRVADAGPPSKAQASLARPLRHPAAPLAVAAAVPPAVARPPLLLPAVAPPQAGGDSVVLLSP